MDIEDSEAQRPPTFEDVGFDTPLDYFSLLSEIRIMEQNSRLYTNFSEPDFAPFDFEALATLSDPVLRSSSLGGTACIDLFPDPPELVEDGDKDENVCHVLGSFDSLKRLVSKIEEDGAKSSKVGEKSSNGISESTKENYAKIAACQRKNQVVEYTGPVRHSVSLPLVGRPQKASSARDDWSFVIPQDYRSASSVYSKMDVSGRSDQSNTSLNTSNWAPYAISVRSQNSTYQANASFNRSLNGSSFNLSRGVNSSTDWTSIESSPATGKDLSRNLDMSGNRLNDSSISEMSPVCSSAVATPVRNFSLPLPVSRRSSYGNRMPEPLSSTPKQMGPPIGLPFQKRL